MIVDAITDIKNGIVQTDRLFMNYAITDII